ncbi:MAG TPA: hypothetical protein VHW02_11050 [Rhizomicrobium sp.]|jgi:DNA/RNA endonuclease YhcR with UshA esterase domain|nr:hypothetical protein [Rhizomicrobium sp.]
MRFWALLVGVVAAGLATAWATAPSAPADLQPLDILRHTGQTIHVQGRVSDVFTDRRSGVTFIDMGGAYPDNKFVAVIFPENAGAFPNAGALDGLPVTVTGRINLYRGKPEIVLRNPSQIARQ